MHDILPQLKLVPRYSANNYLFGKILRKSRGSVKHHASNRLWESDQYQIGEL